MALVGCKMKQASECRPSKVLQLQIHVGTWGLAAQGCQGDPDWGPDLMSR